MIKRAGENVAASEVEAVLLQHHAVRDAAVFGIPDVIRDEEIVACVALDDAEATAAAMDDGWLRTGDILRLDPDGLYSFVDRRKDMIKRAGENVAASEVEAVLLEHPAVRDAAVFGIPDAIRDEEIVACVALGAAVDPAALMAWCGDRLAAFRVPGRIVVVDEMPRTPVGKIQKHVLRGDVLAAGNGDGSAADGAGPLL
jgi:acyl-CoA synthetase (AMP-forming)/AMP-acid ligase II